MAVAKALLSLQKALQGRPAHQKETNYISQALMEKLMDSEANINGWF